MALEYTLFLSSDFEKKETFIDKFLSESNIIVQAEAPNDTLRIWPVFVLKGFSQSRLKKTEKIKINNDLFAFDTHLTFRMSKNFDPLQWWHNMIDFVKEVIKEIHPEYLLLLFNSEIVIMMKDAEKLYLDNTDDVEGHSIVEELNGVFLK